MYDATGRKPFTLVMENRDRQIVNLLYDPHTSILSNEFGAPLFEEPPPRAWREHFAVSPENPNSKTSTPKRLKIQLGLGCNYSCAYCLQASSVGSEAKTSTWDARAFLLNLDNWLKGAPDKIEFWGGEPMLYWHKIELLLPALKAKFPDAAFTIITNGSLFTPTIIDALVKNGVGIGISHDGPGQHVRGPDPFEDPDKLAMIKLAIEKLPPGRVSFNAVLTPASHDVSKVIDWFQERWGDAVPIGFEGVVHDYHGDANARFTDQQLKDFTWNLTMQIVDGSAMRAHTIVSKMDSFAQSLAKRRPSFALGQKCGMDREDQLAVDLLGNVMTCQNVGAEGRHKIGHVNTLNKTQLTTAWHWSHREECTTCPVLQLCAGACMYNEGDAWANSCWAEFAFNTAIMAGALYYLTGMVLRRIDGDMVRPATSG